MNIHDAIEVISSVPGSKLKDNTETIMMFNAVGKDLKAINGEVESVKKKMESLENTVSEIKSTVDELINMHTATDKKFDLILEKLSCSATEENAVVGSKIQSIVKSKYFWVSVSVFIALCFLAGFSISGFLSKADSVAKIASAIK